MNSSPFFIYRIGESELEKLRKIAIRTFSETFATTNRKEDMDGYFSRCFNPDILLKELRNPGSFFWFIEKEGVLAGYLKVNIGKSQTELKEEEGFEVERIYVLRKFYGSGAGKELMEHAIGFGQELKKKYLWLGVYEKNFRALHFYSKFGLTEFGDHVFMMGEQPQRDVLMKLPL